MLLFHFPSFSVCNYSLGFSPMEIFLVSHVKTPNNRTLALFCNSTLSPTPILIFSPDISEIPLVCVLYSYYMMSDMERNMVKGDIEVMAEGQILEVLE